MKLLLQSVKLLLQSDEKKFLRGLNDRVVIVYEQCELIA